MGRKDAALMQEGWALFTRLFMKYDVVGKAPLEISASEKLSASSIHMIEAVGKGYGDTITALSSYFMITKGAVSQIITKLHKAGYIAKAKRQGNDKEVVLGLTKKGRKAFDLHEKRNKQTLDDLQDFLGKYSEDELNSFSRILTDIEQVLNRSIAPQLRE